MPGLLDMQLEQLRERFGEVQTRQLPSGPKTLLCMEAGERLPVITKPYIILLLLSGCSKTMKPY